MTWPLLRMVFATFFLLPVNSRSQPILEFSLFSSGYENPVDIAHAGDSRLFIVEQEGRIMISDSLGNPFPQPFLDIRSQVGSAENEQGLLGLVFDPAYDENGFFYVNYTNLSGDTHIARFSVNPTDANQADAGSEEVLLTVSQPFGNHNAGDLNFGPDGMLYIALGDGGSAGDPGNRSQDGLDLLGKILRIDVSNPPLYTIPPDNPYVDDPFILDEIFAFGLRNPWRFSFDALTGDLWISDVGQDQREEINFVDRDHLGGQNYGWRCYEANLPFNLSGCSSASDYDFPLFSYPHDLLSGGVSVTGGYVYRGETYEDLQGHYVFADFVSGNFWTIYRDQGEWKDSFHPSLALNVSTFGTDYREELYFARLDNGNIYRLEEFCSTLPAPEISFAGDTMVASEGESYQWYLNDELIEGAEEQSFLPEVNGAYQVAVTLENGCVKFSEPVMALALAEEAGAAFSLRLFPNPASGFLQVEWPPQEDLQLNSLLVFSSGGRKILEISLHEENTSGGYRLDVHNWPEGTYLIQLIGEKGLATKAVQVLH